jgi:hypothetical protein
MMRVPPRAAARLQEASGAAEGTRPASTQRAGAARWKGERVMKVRVLLLSSLLLSACAVAAYAAEEEKDPKKEGDKNARFEQFKQLAGEWVGKMSHEGGKEGEEIHVKYKTVSGGSAVVETIAPDTEHEMVTVITPDGDDLTLTHYCMLGNQPHMKADGKGDAGKVAFKFTSAGNLKSDKDMHMHDATFTFVDKDTLKTEWTLYRDGKAAGTAVIELKRKK